MMTVSEVVDRPGPEGICQVTASHSLAAVEVTFDEDHIVANAALVAPALLAQRLGLGELVKQRLHHGGAGAAHVDVVALGAAQDERGHLPGDGVVAADDGSEVGVDGRLAARVGERVDAGLGSVGRGDVVAHEPGDGGADPDVEAVGAPRVGDGGEARSEAVGAVPGAERRRIVDERWAAVLRA